MLEQLTIPGLESERTYTYDDVAEIFRVTKQTVYNWVSSGMVAPPTYYGSSARFSLQQVNAMKSGLSPIGTFPPHDSPRAKLGRLGAAAKKAKAAGLRPRRKPAASKVKPVKPKKGKGQL